jgi:hypothetical protein
MRYRFIEYKGDLYVVVGITHDQTQSYPECFTAVPVTSSRTLTECLLERHVLTIPFSEAIEITNKNTILALMVLYGC